MPYHSSVLFSDGQVVYAHPIIVESRRRCSSAPDSGAIRIYVDLLPV